MKKIFITFVVFIICLFFNVEARAYSFGVWDSSVQSANLVKNLQSQKIDRYSISSVNPKNTPVIIFYNYSSIDEETYRQIVNYVNYGGKLVLSVPTSSADDKIYIRLARLLGVNVNSLVFSNYPMEVNWVEKTIINNTIPAKSRVAKVSLFGETEHLAVFGDIEKHESAISYNSNGCVFSWSIGKSGEKSFNDKSLDSAISKLLPRNILGLSKNYSETRIDDYNEDITKLQKTRDFIELYQDNPINYAIGMADSQQNIELSKIEELKAIFYAKNNESKLYEKSLASAREKAYKSMKSVKKYSPADQVGIWFDRGTIVNIKTKAEMGRYFDKLKNCGIDTVYFETVNAGYTIYPSKVGTQNPLTRGRNPLSWAVSEAHSRNMKIHAWVWVFAVGNDRHNKLVGKSNSYPGPVLAKNPSFAMLGEQGNFRPKNQPEFWIDPSNQNGVNYLLRLIEEIVGNYDVDGIQLDYIRYPFQSSDNLMGFNHNSVEQYSAKTGEKLFNNNFQTNFMWNKWKEANVNSFVRKTVSATKKIRPGIKISASVFAKTPSNRLNTIQQNYENWIANSYLDSLTPMTYSMSESALENNLAPLQSQIGSCLIYPGIALQHVDETGVLKQVLKIREEGFPGVSLFALAQLKDKKSDFLEQGIFADNIQSTTYNPKKSAVLLLEEYSATMSSLLKTNYDLSYSQKQALQNLLAMSESAISKVNSGQISGAINSIKNLECHTANFYNNFSCCNSIHKQVVVSYLKRAENLLKIVEK